MSWLRLAIVVAFLWSNVTNKASAEELYPTRPVRIVSPYAPGGTPDVIARILAENLTQRLKQSFYVENRTGANGLIASELVAAASADGYTLLLASDGPVVIMPLLKPNSDFSKRLVPINLTAESSFVLMARLDLPVKNLADVIALAKREKLTFGSSGVGSQHHIAAELLKSQANIDLTHVPYRGATDAITDLVGKRIDLLFGGLAPSLPYIAAEQVRAIAVTSEKRSEKLPETPTIAEEGFAEYKVVFWAGLMAPAGTPDTIIRKLNDAISQIVKSPDVRARMGANGVQLVSLGPPDFSKRLRDDQKIWSALVQRAGLRAP